MLFLTDKKHCPYLKIIAILIAIIFSLESVGYSAQDTAACRTNLRAPIGANYDEIRIVQEKAVNSNQLLGNDDLKIDKRTRIANWVIWSVVFLLVPFFY